MKNTYSFRLSEDDFLVYTLYNASTSRMVRRRRIRMRWVVSVLYIGMGAWLSLAREVRVGGIVFAAFGLLWLLFYPRYSAWRYKRTYRRIVREQTRDRVNKTYDMELGAEQLLVRNESSESKISYSGISEVVVLSDYFLLILKERSGLVVPRRDVPEPGAFLDLFREKGVSVQLHEDWRWK
ncbi:MAG: YcxB family protein [Bacteroidia bacterium]|nr:YcxB family protein [Bacteroidia bacterium]